MPDSAVQFHKDRSLPKGPIHYPFWFGGSASCFAICFTHPLDLVKVRLQTQSHAGTRLGMGKMFAHVFREHGIRGLYKGLTAAQLRQLTYSMTRFGVYDVLKEKVTGNTPSQQPGLGTLILISSLAGFMGGVVGNPADVLNVRMQHDAALPAAERYNYRHAIDGLIRISREEGVGSLFRGVWPNSGRAALMTASQLASYDSIKGALLGVKALHMKDDMTTHFTASIMAGFVATTVCSPVDVIKTRIMSAKKKSGFGSLLVDIYKKEGLTWCFKGWVPSFIRLGPTTILIFLAKEQHQVVYRKWWLGLPE